MLDAGPNFSNMTFVMYLIKCWTAKDNMDRKTIKNRGQ